MRRREFLGFMSGLLVGSAIASAEGEPRVYRVGVLNMGSPRGPNYKAFFESLAKLGFVEGKTLWIDDDGFVGLAVDRFPAHARELAAAGVDIIVASGGDAAIRAAEDATRTIPILGVADDLVGAGFVASLARPGGNITGVSILSNELNLKRQEILLALMPEVRRIAALADPNTVKPASLEALGNAARQHRVDLEIIPVQGPDAVATAAEHAAASGCGALNVLASPLFYNMRATLIARCEALRLPAIYHLPEMAEEGGLVAYGPRMLLIFRNQLPRLFQKLVEGADPAALPAEQPSEVDLVINLKAANALELRVPESVLAEASSVVE